MADRPRVAVACQGGGSHTAFTAGALKAFLRAEHYDLVAFSGTSGGAIDALVAWYGLLRGDRHEAADQLDALWRDISARSWPDLAANTWALSASRALAPFTAPEISPYLYPPWASSRLRQVLTGHVDFDEVADLVGRTGPSTPALLVGAVDVLSGSFRVFRSGWDDAAGRPALEVTPEAVLASAAIPTLFRSAPVDGNLYWDGLFSQNPPVRDLPDARPDQIWVVQINPSRRRSEPTSMADIRDRRNELAGNLSLRQELFFIETINRLVRGDDGRNRLDPATRYRVIDVHTLEMAIGRNLDTESKLDRSPAFIGALLELGEQQAADFLDRRAAADAVSPPAPPRGGRGSRTPR